MGAQQSAIANRKSQMARRRRRLFGLWKRVCEARRIAGTREERLEFANSQITNRQSPIASWSELVPSEVGRLIWAMRRALGQEEPQDRSAGPALRYVLWLVPQVYGERWDELLHARLEGQPYFFHDSVERLDGRRMHGLIEELLDVLARKRIQDSGFGIQEEVPGAGCQLSGKELRAAKEAVREEMIAAVRGKVKG